MSAILIACLGMGSQGAFAAYEEIEVADGGTLSGTITLKGEQPRPKGYNLVSFPDPAFCGRISNGKGWRLLQPFQVGANGEFENVVVYLEGIKKGKKFDYTPSQIEAIDCKFAPYITIVRDRHEVKVVNMDPVMHDIQAYETSKLGARVLFNLPLPVSAKLKKTDLMNGKKVKNRAGRIVSPTIKMKKGRHIFAMQCGFHPYMESWGLAMDSPYFALTDQQGTFTIDGIPPGTYKAVIWHPMIQKEMMVTIEPNSTTDLSVEFDSPKGRLYANEAHDNTRFGMELLGDSQIVPMVELQQ
ncbi:MAG: carboxypeptidase regulatory-like domain-containing protein [Nitrospirales bacterium]|nr:carboxypeptidase regulatory-like domain-containing protein [Nitrospira sp.]MDR4502543.1 carboxypeptidase regulatory-like domain-containing protein [Nitrospirales bacterium]